MPTHSSILDPFQLFIEICSHELAKIASINNSDNRQAEWEPDGFDNAEAGAKHLAADYLSDAHKLAEAIKAAGLELILAMPAEPGGVADPGEGTEEDLAPAARFVLPERWYNDGDAGTLNTRLPGIYE